MQRNLVDLVLVWKILFMDLVKVDEEDVVDGSIGCCDYFNCLSIWKYVSDRFLIRWWVCGNVF